MSEVAAARERRAVFLDRDGTLIEEVGYLDRIEQARLFPWSIDAVRLLNRAGLLVIVATNQSGVARGYFTEERVNEVHRYLDSLMSAGGARIDAYYYCPHHPAGVVEAYTRRCDCRKPGRGLVDRAVGQFAIDPARSFVVGDRRHDVEMAHAVGARGVLLRTGDPMASARRSPPEIAADAYVDTLIDATSWILGQTRSVP